MKLHPIYVALDGHQYSRAIKLALALPDSHVLGKALLAHAYSKSGQRYESLLVLQSILGVDTFCELEHEIQYSLQARDEKNAVTSTTAAAAASASDSSSNKKGKKGKKGKSAAPKPAPVAATIAAAMTSPKQQKDWDWIEQLNTPPTLPEKWEELPSPETAITDEVSESVDSVCLYVCLDEGMQMNEGFKYWILVTTDYSHFEFLTLPLDFFVLLFYIIFVRRHLPHFPCLCRA